MNLKLLAIFIVVLTVVCVLMYNYGYNMVMGIAPMDDVDYNNNQSIIDALRKTERFYLKFTDMMEACNTYDTSIHDMCITLFVDFNKRIDGYFTNHTEEVETILYR